MRYEGYVTSRAGAWALAGLLVAAGPLVAGCGASSGGAHRDEPTAVAVELTYDSPPGPLTLGLASAMATAAPAPSPVFAMPDSTVLRLVVEGPDFAPVVCLFLRKSGGRCGGVPAGTGRTVTVEEWDEGLETLYFRGRATGVQVHAGRDTRVAVRLQPPVAVRFPADGAALGHRTFEALVQADPGSTVQLFVGPNPIGPPLVADPNGVAVLPLTDAGPGFEPPDDGSPGLADGTYLLGVVAYPPRAPGDPNIQHVGPPLTFEVDLQPPSLQISAPTVTSSSSIDLHGVTEPGTAVQCSEGAAVDGVEVVPEADGRFSLLGVRIGPVSTELVCGSTDRAGNTTLRSLTVVHLPDGFTVDASLPDVTNQPRATLDIRTDPTVSDLVIEVSGNANTTPLRTIVPNAAGTGTFSVPVDLHRNQWNLINVSARISEVVLGEVELAIEQDDIPPEPPVFEWYSFYPREPVVEPGRLYYDSIQIGFTRFAPGVLVELHRWLTLDQFCCSTTPVLDLSSGDSELVITEDGTSGLIRVPSGKCYIGFPAQAIDRAGNVSEVGGLSGLPSTELCTR